MKVTWSKKALRKLHQTADYIAEEFGAECAGRFIDKAIDAAKHLEQFPKLGQEEASLTDAEYEYRRRVVTKQSRFIYRIQKDKVRVVDFWTSKQNPALLVAGLLD